jgi:hypothetical protein
MTTGVRVGEILATDWDKVSVKLRHLALSPEALLAVLGVDMMATFSQCFSEMGFIYIQLKFRHKQHRCQFPRATAIPARIFGSPTYE